MLADKISHYQKEKKMLKNTPAGYKKEYPWLKEVDLRTAYRILPVLTVDKLVLDGQHVKKVFGEIDKTSFVSILVMEGKGTIRDKEETLTSKKKDSLFVTANIGEYELEGAFEALVTTV